MGSEDLQVEHQVSEPISKRNLSTISLVKVVAAQVSNHPGLLWQMFKSESLLVSLVTVV